MAPCNCRSALCLLTTLARRFRFRCFLYLGVTPSDRTVSLRAAGRVCGRREREREELAEPPMAESPAAGLDTLVAGDERLRHPHRPSINSQLDSRASDAPPSNFDLPPLRVARSRNWHRRQMRGSLSRIEAPDNRSPEPRSRAQRKIAEQVVGDNDVAVGVNAVGEEFLVAECAGDATCGFNSLILPDFTPCRSSPGEAAYATLAHRSGGGY
jgi:hypothetical protein